VRVVGNTSQDRRTVEHSSLTAAQRSQRARIAALARHSRSDGQAATSAARSAFLARFEREVDPEGRLDPAERVRRAEAAKRAYFQRLAFARSRKAS
jgi:hypothetical protein